MSDQNLEIQIGLKIEEEEAKSQLNTVLNALKATVGNKANDIKINLKVDKKGLGDLKKIETAVKEINKLSVESQKALFRGGSRKGLSELDKQRKEQEKIHRQMLAEAEKKQNRRIKEDNKVMLAGMQEEKKLRRQQQKEREKEEREQLKSQQQRRKEQTQMYRQMFDDIDKEQKQRTRREQEYSRQFDRIDKDEKNKQDRIQREREQSFKSIANDIKKAQSQVDTFGKSGYIDQGELEKIKASLREISNIHVWDNLEALNLEDERGQIERVFDSLKQMSSMRLDGLRGDKVGNFSSKITSDLDNIEKELKEVGKTADSIQGIDRLREELKGLSQVAPDKLPQTFTRIRQEVSQLKSELNEITNSFKTQQNEEARRARQDQELMRANAREQQRIQEQQAREQQRARESQFNSIARDIEKAQSKLGSLSQSGYVNDDELVRVLGLLDEIRSVHVWENVESLNLDDERAELDSLLESIEQLDNERLDGLRGDRLGNSVARMTSDLDRLEEQLQSLGQSTDGVERLRAEIASLDQVAPDRLPQELQRIRQEITQMNGDVTQLSRTGGGFRGFIGDLGDSLRTFTLGNMIGDGIASSVRKAVTSFKEMDDAITNVKKVAQDADIDSTMELDAIKEKAISIAKEVGMSTTDVINGISASLQAGMGSMEQSIAVARSSLMLANVGDMTQNQASSAINTVIKGFDISPLKSVQKEMNGTVVKTNELTEAMDLLNFAGNNYAIGTDGVAEALKRGGSVLHEYGVSLSDTVALVTSANEAVQNPEKVGNGMKSIAINLAGMKASAKDGTLELNKTAKALSEIAGIDVYEDKKTGKVKDMVKVLEEVQKKWGSLREDEQRALSEAIAGKQQAMIFQSLMGNFKTFQKMKNEFDQNMHIGSAEQENAQYVDSISGKLNALKETWVSIAQTMVKSDFTKGLLDGAIGVSEAIDMIVKGLDKAGALTPTIVGLGVALGSMVKTMVANGRNNVSLLTPRDMPLWNTLRTNVERATTAMGKLKAVGSTGLNALKDGIKSVGQGFVNAGKFMLSFAGQAVIMMAVTYVIEKIIKGLDNLAHGLENTEKQIKETIGNINEEVSKDQNNLKFLNDTEARYNELIKKKQEYSQTPVENWTDEQIADMEELKGITSELADMFPELVMGYDEEGSPIMLMADDMEKLKEKTKEQIRLNQEMLKLEREKLANNARDRAQKGNFFGLGEGTIEKLDRATGAHQEAYSTIQGDQKQMIQAMINNSQVYMNQLDSNLAKEKEKSRVSYEERLQHYQKFTQQEQEIQQNAFDRIQAIRGYDKLGDKQKDIVHGFLDSLNWGSMDKNQFNSWIAGSQKIIDLAQKGSPKLQEWGKKLEGANKTFSQTGDMKEYEKSLKGVATAISKELNIPYDTVFAGLKNMAQPLNDAEQSMQNFLSTFKKSRADLLGGDNVAVALALAEQFQAVDETLQNLIANRKDYFNADGVLDINIATEIANKDAIPDQIQSAISEFTKDGKMNKQETDITLGLLGAFELGNTDEAKKKIEEINTKLKEMGREDLQIDIKTLFDSSKIETLEAQLNKLREGSDVNLKVIVNGEDKAKLFQEIIQNLQNTPEVTNKFILDNKDALADMNSYEDVLKWLQANPDIVSKYQLKVEGLEELEKAEEKKKKVEKNGSSTTTFKEKGATEVSKKVDEVDKKTDKVNKKEVKVKANSDAVQASIEDIETLVKYSAEIEKGKYKLSIDTDTQKAVDNIKKLEDAMKSITKIMSSSPKMVFKAETAQASKNITGLVNNAKRFGNLKQSGTKLVFKSETAQASKNITGLINNAKRCMRLKPKPIVFKAYTAQAAKNITGLINKINSVPTGTKSINYNVKTNYSTTGTPSAEAGKPKKRAMSAPTRGASMFSMMPVVGALKGSESPMTSLQDEPQPFLLSRSSVSPLMKLANRAITQKTPLAIKGNDISDALRYSLELLKELDNRITMVNNQLSLLDKKAEKAIGKDKIKYLQEQNKLYEEQKRILKEQEDAFNRQINNYKYYLQNVGMKFNKDGNMTNYEEMLLKKERELEALEKKANKDNAKDSDKNKYESKKKQLDELKMFADAYFKLSFEELPKLKEEWENLNNEILDNLEAIQKVKDEMKKLQEDTQYKNHNRDISEIKNKLDKNQIQLDNSTGQNQIEYLEERIRLTSELKNETQDLLKYEELRRKDLMKELGDYGFKFREDGSIQSYGQVIEKLKNELTDSEFERVFAKIEDYISTTNEKIPELEKEILELGYSTEKFRNELAKLERERALEPHLNAIKELENEYDKIADKLSLIEIKIKNAYGTDKINLIKEQINLLEQQREEQEKLTQQYQNMVAIYQKDLGNFGIEFDNNGDIVDLDGVLNKYQDHKDLKVLKELVDEYLDIQRDKLPDAVKEWENLGSAIKDAYKEQLNTTKEIEDKITEVYKKQKEERIKLIDEELKKRVDALNKEKEAYNKAREESKYQNNYNEQLDKVKKLESQLEIAKRDTSIGGKKKIQDLLDQLKEEQKKLQEMVQDKIDDQINDMFDEENDRLEEEANKAKDEIEDAFSDKKIQELVKEALNTGVFEDIDGTMRSLQDVMLEFVDEYGEGLGATGDLIKNELIANLEVAKDTMKDIAKISKDLGLIKYSYDSESTQKASRSINQTPLGAKQDQSVVFNEPLINIEGNVDKNIVDELKEIAKNIENKVTNSIVKALR